MSTATSPRTFTSEEVRLYAEVTYKQLHYWCERGFLQPAHQGSGIGHPRVWTERETIKAVCLARMVRAGITPQRAAQFLDAGVLATLVTQPLPEVLG